MRVPASDETGFMVSVFADILVTPGELNENDECAQGAIASTL